MVIRHHKYFQLSLRYASVIFEKIYDGTTGFVKERELLLNNILAHFVASLLAEP